MATRSAGAVSASAATKPVRPFVLMAVLSFPAGIVAFGAVYGVLWLLSIPNDKDVAGLLGLVVFVAMLAGGMVGIVRRSRSSRAMGTIQSPGAPIGRTTDGEPIYPVVGYTSDGKPVTADRAAGVRAQPTGTNGLAIASLILAFVLAPVGLIIGVVARSQIKKTGQQGSGLALTAMIIGGVFTAISVATLIALATAMG